MYNDILALSKYIYIPVQANCCWFKEYIKTMDLEVWFKPFKSDPIILYRVNKIGTEIFILYIYYKLVIRDKPVLMGILNYIRNEYTTRLTSPLEEFLLSIAVHVDIVTRW